MPRQRARDLLWEELVKVCGADDTKMTSSERGRYNKALKQLKEVGATVEEIASKARVYRAKYSNIDITPTALAAHWSTLRPQPSRYKDYVPQGRTYANDDGILSDNEEVYLPVSPEVLAENRRRLHQMLEGLQLGDE